MTGLGSTLTTIWRIAAPYFRSEDRWPGRMLLAVVIGIELALVGMQVVLNYWNARFYNALQARDWSAFIGELVFFCEIAAPYVIIAVYQYYLNQMLQIRWRQWMTRRYVGWWLVAGNHYRMQLQGDAADNPDQRIAEDIRLFIDRTMGIGLNLLNAVVSLGSFIVILWSLSDAAPLHLFGADLPIPGYLVWGALLYAASGTLLTHLIGRKLISLYFNQQRYEADFRFNLVRVRENGEQIALLHGEAAEGERLNALFGSVVRNWRLIMSRVKALTFFTSGYTQVSVIIPYILVSPAYFAGKIPFGGLTQTASAFNQVQTALSVFISVYREIADWRAVIERLAGFTAGIEKAERVARKPPVVSVVAAENARHLQLTDLKVRLPSGRPLVAAQDIAFSGNGHVLVTGPTGSGKSTLFRVIGGIWPFGSGSVTIPASAKVMVLPQRPYLPIGSLGAAVCYPAVAGSFPQNQIHDVLIAVGLPELAERLEEENHWNRELSLGEQQRLAVARAILHAPDYLFLDEATASLDESSEAALYRLLHDRLKRTVIVSIGHRSTLRAFHHRHLTLARDGDYLKVRETALEAAE